MLLCFIRTVACSTGAYQQVPNLSEFRYHPAGSRAPWCDRRRTSLCFSSRTSCLLQNPNSQVNPATLASCEQLWQPLTACVTLINHSFSLYVTPPFSCACRHGGNQHQWHHHPQLGRAVRCTCCSRGLGRAHLGMGEVPAGVPGALTL